MITIYYPTDSKVISIWQERLDRLFMKYKAVPEEQSFIPKLIDGDKEFEGVTNIETYLNELEDLVKGWYEDRCDRYEFDPDASKN